MAISAYSNLGMLAKTNTAYNKNFSRLRDGNSKFNINSYSTNNQSSINLNSSKKATTTYDLRGRNSNRNLSSQYSVDGIRQLLQNKFNQNVPTGIRRETEAKPTVKVNRVVDIKEKDFTGLYNYAIKGPLASHVKERGIYKDKKYIVLDNVRYESKIYKSERLQTEKYQWMNR